MMTEVTGLTDCFANKWLTVGAMVLVNIQSLSLIDAHTAGICEEMFARIQRN